jgi:hypothetical protein
MDVNANDKTIESVLTGGFYRVPRFQRPYSWDSSNVEDFWDDVARLRRALAGGGSCFSNPSRFACVRACATEATRRGARSRCPDRRGAGPARLRGRASGRSLSTDLLASLRCDAPLPAHRTRGWAVDPDIAWPRAGARASIGCVITGPDRRPVAVKPSPTPEDGRRLHSGLRPASAESVKGRPVHGGLLTWRPRRADT